LIDLEPTLEPIRAVFRVPGLAAALVRDGHLAAIGTTGTRRVGSEQRLALDDPFHLGSCGKAITATVAAIMVERGMIEWTTTIGEVYPEYSSTMHSLYRHVTLRDLLAHRGGFGSRNEVFDNTVAGFGGDLPDQRSELVRYAVASVPDNEPGTRFTYSDIGYSVAGALLGKAAGRPWEDLVQEFLSDPLALETLGFGAPGVDDPQSVPRGHVLKGETLEAMGVGVGEDLANPVIGPAGNIHMGLRDWATFATLHLKGARAEETGLLSTEGFKVLHEDSFAQGYSLGWFRTASKWGNGRAFTHTGSCGAWAALIWILPEVNAIILVTTNYGGGSGYQALQLAADQLGQQFLAQ
jgi:CubicO group peptidase (beta-lactamase class C family)